MFDWVKKDLKNFGNYCDAIDIKKMDSKSIDIAFIGSGLSSTFTLIEFINQIEDKVNSSSKLYDDRTLKIAMFEKDSWLWGGIPYGRRSGYTSLLITPLDEFLPEEELPLFVNWIAENIDWLIPPFKKYSGPRSKKWLENSEKKIRSGNSSSIHVPRYFFGIYIWDKLRKAVSNSSINIKLDFIKAEATSVKMDKQKGFEVCVNNDTFFYSNQVLLGVGIPQIRNLSKNNKENYDVIFFNDPYNPDLESTILNIHAHIQREKSSDILIVGANASALELIYQITNLNNFENFDVNFSVLSPQGKLPGLFVKDKKTDFIASALEDIYKSDEEITAELILDSFKRDLDFADNNNYLISDTLSIFTKHIGSLSRRLSKDEKNKFVSHHGLEIGRLQRRAGLEYIQPIEKLIASENINMIKGKFIGFANHKNKTVVEFQTEDKVSNKKNHFDIVINCAGSAGLKSGVTSPLLSQLIDSGLCKPTPSNHGFIVGSKFDVVPNFYINGPLLAGNVVGEMGIWHVEHCGRIISFAKQIANYMIENETIMTNLIQNEDSN